MTTWIRFWPRSARTVGRRLRSAGPWAMATALLAPVFAGATPITLGRTETSTDYVSAGVCGAGGGSGTIVVAGVTGGVRKAFLYWHGIDMTGAGAVYDNASITFGGSPVTGTSLGDASTNCWGAGSGRGFFADVTALVTGNGSYLVSGLSSGEGHSGNGASLIVLFDDGNPANDRDLVFFEGNDSDIADLTEFPDDPDGWAGTLDNIGYAGGSVYAQLHAADGQDAEDGTVTFTGSGGPVAVSDDSTLWDGISVPDAGTGRQGNGLWDIHTFDVTAAFGAPGVQSLGVSGMTPTSDCHALIVMMLDLEAGSAPCGNGTIDDGEECDPEATNTCSGVETCLNDCTCGCTTDAHCNDGVACTVDSCTVGTGECVNDAGACGTTTTTTSTTSTTTSTTTTTTIATGACCFSGGCFETTQGSCLDGPPGRSYEGDGTSCSDPGACADCGNGLVEFGEECDDANTTTGDGCDDACTEEACWTCSEPSVSTTVPPTTTIGATGASAPSPGPSICVTDDGQSCEDGDECTVGDHCVSGTCSSTPVIIPAACDWVMVAGDPSRRVQSRVRGFTTVVGDVCGETTRVGIQTSLDGDVVAMAATGNVSSILGATSDVTGDVITGGAKIRTKPRMTPLPGLAVDEVATGMVVAQMGDPSREYDTTGTNPRLADCNDAQDDLDPAGSALTSLDAQTQTEDRGDVFVKRQTSLTIVAPNPGGRNVIDFTRLRIGNRATFTLDGGGVAGTEFILRIARKFDVKLDTQIVLTNGATAERTIFYGKRKCRIGEQVTGGGTIICPDGKVLMNERTEWGGSLLGGRAKVELRDKGELTHVPLQIGG